LAVIEGDLNHRKPIWYDTQAPALSTPFNVAIGPMTNAAGAPMVCSLRAVTGEE